MDYKMIFLDLDNTLLSNDLSISEENLRAIRAASEKGVKIIICTGRGVFSVKHIAAQFGINWENCYIICLNGGAVYKGYPPVLIKERLFESKSAMIVYETAKKYGVDIQIYRNDKLIIEKITERIQMYIDKLKAEYEIVGDITQYDGRISKILLNGEHEKLEKIQKELKSRIDGKLNCFFSSDTFLEFTSEGTTKGEAMKDLAETLGIDIKETIAIGDSFNDMSMIKTAGLGVAVRNAVQPLKDEAQYITKHTNDESAVAEVIDRYIFGKIDKTIGEYKFRIPVRIFIILFIIEQLLAFAFNINVLKIWRYVYEYGVDKYKIGFLGILIPFILCFVVDYFNQRTKKEDEEEFWESKYGKR